MNVTKTTPSRRSKFLTREQHRAHPLSYGGELFKSRLGRRLGGRYLSPQHTLHLVLRSLLAKGAWSFSKTTNKRRIEALSEKFAAKYDIKIYSVAYAGNHIHAHIKIPNRTQYRRFIRALTGAIVMAITGASRWAKAAFKGKFWSSRPFTRIVRGIKEFTRVQEYVEINRMETRGYTRDQARFLIAWAKDPPWDPFSGSA